MFVYRDFLVFFGATGFSDSQTLYNTSLIFSWTIVKNSLIFSSLEKLSLIRESLSLN